jgi:hypothetical protein
LGEKRRHNRPSETPIPSDTMQAGLPNYWTRCTTSSLKFNGIKNLYSLVVLEDGFISAFALKLVLVRRVVCCRWKEIGREM